MATRTPSRPREEIWELTVPGRVSMTVSNERGGTRPISAKGIGAVLRISAIDRELTEEQIRRPELNPFKNGKLVRVDAGKATRETPASNDELSDDDLKEMFALDNSDFEGILGNLSEVNVRRLSAMAKTEDVRHAQVQLLADHIEKNYSVGGDTPSYREAMADPAGRGN